MESGYIHILPKGEVSNGTWSWRDKGRLGIGPGMLPGGIGLKRKPYLDGWRKEPEGHGGSRDNQAGGKEPTKATKVGTNLTISTREKIIDFLKENLHVFVWSHEDMLSILVDII